MRKYLIREKERSLDKACVGFGTGEGMGRLRKSGKKMFTQVALLLLVMTASCLCLINHSYGPANLCYKVGRYMCTMDKSMWILHTFVYFWFGACFTIWIRPIKR